MRNLVLVTFVDYAIFMLQPNGRVATWNGGAQRIKGYSADEIIGRHFSTFYSRVRAGCPGPPLRPILPLDPHGPADA